MTQTGTTYAVRPLSDLQFRAFGPKLWAVVEVTRTGRVVSTEPIDVYEDKDIADAWVAYTNKRKAAA